MSNGPLHIDNLRDIIRMFNTIMKGSSLYEEKISVYSDGAAALYGFGSRCMFLRG